MNAEAVRLGMSVRYGQYKLPGSIVGAVYGDGSRMSRANITHVVVLCSVRSSGPVKPTDYDVVPLAEVKAVKA